MRSLAALLILATTIVGEPKAPKVKELPANMEMHDMIAELCKPTPNADVFLGSGSGMYRVVPCSIILKGKEQVLDFLVECKEKKRHHCIGYHI